MGFCLKINQFKKYNKNCIILVDKIKIDIFYYIRSFKEYYDKD